MLYIAEVVAIIEEAKERGEHSHTFINLSSYVRHILIKVGYKIRFSIDENWNILKCVPKKQGRKLKKH